MHSTRTAPSASAIKHASAILFALIFPLLNGCASRRATRVNTPQAPVAVKTGTTEEGIASWYGEPYHGRRAANGEIFDMEQPVAAHPFFPFETWLEVRNLSNRKSTLVRVIDRGPFVRGRIVDLSKSAAREIDLIRPGTAKVRLTVVDAPQSYTRNRRFTVQVSNAFEERKAETLRKLLAKDFSPVEVRHREANPKGGHAESWRVLVGKESGLARAQSICAELRPRFPNAFVVGWDVD